MGGTGGGFSPAPLEGARGRLIEQLLIREVVRHGEEIIFEGVETDDGGTISLSVAQYVHFDLSQDGLKLANPLYQQILEEAVQHQQEPGFVAHKYFSSHPDPNISHAATAMLFDRHQLGGRFQMQPREDSLRKRVLHLMMDYRLAIVEARLKEIQTQMRTSSADISQTLELMKEYKDVKEIRDTLAKQLGSELFL